VKDLLAILGMLAAHGVTIAVPILGIDTSTGPAAVLELAAAYRKAKTSLAIRRGQERARLAGKHVGRPPIPPGVRRRILADLAAGSGIRPTARKHNVSPASVVKIEQAMATNPNRVAA
jgi:DNA invertase Pin-like site-specific DNA recombinase